MTQDEIVQVIAYLRVSTDEQGRSGLGLEAQRATIAREIAHRGWDLVATFEDVASGKSQDQRPGLAQALSELGLGHAQAIVVAKLDRISRSVIDFGNILRTAKAEDWAVVALDLGVDTSTTNGKMIAGVMMVLAEWEREMIVDRTRSALAAAKARKVHLGRKSKVPAEVQDRIVAMRRERMTFQAIAAQLNTEHVPPPAGAAWGWTSIQLIVRRHGEAPTHQRPSNRRRITPGP